MQKRKRKGSGQDRGRVRRDWNMEGREDIGANTIMCDEGERSEGMEVKKRMRRMNVDPEVSLDLDMTNDGHLNLPCHPRLQTAASAT